MSSPYKTFAFHTLGCKLNYSESSYLSNQLISEGYCQVELSSLADIYIINTCSVTENADKKADNLIRKINNRSPNSFVVVIGCYAQLKPNKIKKLEGVDLVLSTEDKFNLVEYLNKNYMSDIIVGENIDNTGTFNLAFSSGSRTRSYLKVQDGCDYTCSYCTIPMARGMSRSGTFDEIINAIYQISELNIKEIVLTGVNIGDYHGENGESFFDLIKKVDSLSSTTRFRISSIEPNLLTEKIIDFIINSKKFASHFHIPLQSGSNKILKKMKRRYNKELYESRVKYIRKYSQGACIGSDVIVGFPTESNNDFLDTCNFIKNLDIDYLHVFPYSNRNNTDSILLRNKVDSFEIKNRSKKLRDISRVKNQYFFKKNLDKEHKILFESFNDGYLSGLTENYIKVNVRGSCDLVNSIQPIIINKIVNSNVFGKILI